MFQLPHAGVDIDSLKRQSCVVERLEPRQLLAAAPPWVPEYDIKPWEVNRITAADVIGPDGIVYPRVDNIGVTGGVPSLTTGYTTFNVVNYGANGSDSNPDTAAFVSAINAALTHAASGGKSIVYVPNGTFRINGPLPDINQSNVVIDGASRTGSIILLDPGTSGDYAFHFKGSYIVGDRVQAAADILRGTSTAQMVSTASSAVVNQYQPGQWVLAMHRADYADAPLASGTTNDRYGNPLKNVVYGAGVLGQTYMAKISTLDAANKRFTLDRPLPFTQFKDDGLYFIRTAPVEFTGIQDLTIRTSAANSFAMPVAFENAANSWMSQVTVDKTINHPYVLQNTARLTIRNSTFAGSFASLLDGGKAYLMLSNTNDTLIDTITASDLRHMGILQNVSRSVLRNSTFTGSNLSGQSPQLHGGMPQGNIIEGNSWTFTQARDQSPEAFAVDSLASLRHGPNGPRNVLYRNSFSGVHGTVTYGGGSESPIFVYNTVRSSFADRPTAMFKIADRSFNGIVRGNSLQVAANSPLAIIEDTTSTGWTFRDNRVYGSNGYVANGDGEVIDGSFNRQYDYSAAITTATGETSSIYSWQVANAGSNRLLLWMDQTSFVEGTSTPLRVIRTGGNINSALTVSLTDNSGATSLPSSVTIPAGQYYVDTTINSTTVTSERTINFTASASGYLSDVVTATLIDTATAPAVLQVRPNTAVTNLPSTYDGLQAIDIGTTAAGTQSASGSQLTITGAGLNLGYTTTGGYNRNSANYGRRMLYKTLVGDGSIVARYEGGTSTDAGLILTDDAAASSDFIAASFNGRVWTTGDGTEGHGKFYDVRNVADNTGPVWLRLTKTGTTLKAERAFTAGVPAAGDWQLLHSVNVYNDTGAGNGDYKSMAQLDDDVTRVMHYGMYVTSGSQSTLRTATFSGLAFTGQTMASATTRLQAEDYIGGTNGVAYNDTTSGNSGGVYRQDSVDIQTGTDTDNGHHVGWMRAGEWLRYNASLTPGTYDVRLRVATPNANRSLRVSLGSTLLGRASLPNTGAFTSWQTVTLSGVQVSAGMWSILLIDVDTDVQNLNWIELVRR
jgi:hypothetical protein